MFIIIVIFKIESGVILKFKNIYEIRLIYRVVWFLFK